MTAVPPPRRPRTGPPAVAVMLLTVLCGCTGVENAKDRLTAAPALDVAVPEDMWWEPGRGKFPVTGSAAFAVRNAERRAALMAQLDRLDFRRSEVSVYAGKHIGGIEVVATRTDGRDPALVRLEPRETGGDVVLLTDGRFSAEATAPDRALRHLLVDWIPDPPTRIPGFIDRSLKDGARELRETAAGADRLVILVRADPPPGAAPAGPVVRDAAALTGPAVREAAALLPDGAEARPASPALEYRPPRLISVRAEGPGDRRDWFHVGDDGKVYFVALPDPDETHGGKWLDGDTVFEIDLPDGRLWTFLTERGGTGETETARAVRE